MLHMRYASTDGIDIPTELRVGNQRVELIARPDTGAAYCIFERRYAEALGLDVESGRPQRFRTMSGSFVAYEHEVTLHTLGISSSLRMTGIQQEFRGPVWLA